MNADVLSALACGSKPVSLSDNHIYLIAITGGIGSGKSVVCRILEAMGYAVYDCDSRAKKLMDESEEILAAIRREIASEAVVTDSNGRRVIDRKKLSDVVFNDRNKLGRLNAIVHGEVRYDITKWCMSNIARRIRRATEDSDKYTLREVMFVESAIVLESGLQNMVDAIWNVTAPESIRLARAMRRDNASEEQIKARMRHQKSLTETVVDDSGRVVRVSEIVNDDQSSLLGQIEGLLDAVNLCDDLKRQTALKIC